MAPRGRPPKIAEKRRLEGGTAGQGSVSHRPLAVRANVGTVITDVNRPLPPEDMPPEAQEFWSIAIETLIDLGAVRDIDLPAVRRMCFTYWQCEVLQRTLFEQGHFVYGSTGQMTSHPAESMYRKAEAAFLRMAEQFGLTTLARTRLGYMDVAKRTLEAELTSQIGKNPRKTNRAPVPEPT